MLVTNGARFMQISRNSISLFYVCDWKTSGSVVTSQNYFFPFLRKREILNINIMYRCGRNSELIINNNNILLKVIDTNFSTSQFTAVFNFFKN